AGVRKWGGRAAVALRRLRGGHRAGGVRGGPGACVAPRRDRRGGTGGGQPVPRLVLAGGPFVRAVRVARDAVGAPVRAGAPRAVGSPDRVVGGGLGARDRDPLLRRLPGSGRGRLATRRDGP